VKFHIIFATNFVAQNSDIKINSAAYARNKNNKLLFSQKHAAFKNTENDQ
jgi:hypothetical protein